jgi:transcriptional regulator with XRE-family HTH domain
MSFNQEKFAKNLRLFRTQAGLTQAELAQKIGVGNTSIANFESGRDHKPSVDILCAIADILNISVSQLLGEAQINKSTHSSWVTELLPFLESLDHQNQIVIKTLVHTLYKIKK